MTTPDPAAARCRVCGDAAHGPGKGHAFDPPPAAISRTASVSDVRDMVNHGFDDETAIATIDVSDSELGVIFLDTAEVFLVSVRAARLEVCDV